MAEITGPSYIPRGTKCKCTMGATEQRLNLLVDHGIIATASREPLMNANDHVPMVNIMPFGFCKKGMPCMPLTPVAWVNVNKKHIIDGAPALTEDSKLACAHGGVITIVPLDAGSAEEGKMNELVESAVEKIGLALKMAGAIAAGIEATSPKGLMKMIAKKGIAKNIKDGKNKGKESGGGGGESKKEKDTGAREMSVEDYLKRENQADKMYQDIRNSTDDVSSIARNTNMSEGRIQRIKDHLFNNEHILSEGKGKFSPDYDIGQAWNRLKEGTPTKSDMDLLNHELFESKFEGIFKTNYRKAHDATNQSGRTWTPEE